jgi:RNA polymerase sigma-70 factor, ECF subfamily
MPTAPAKEFEQQRNRLFGIAYRMLGVRSDAEDIVQDAYLRWHDADRSEIRSSEAWLTTVTTRLCIDRLRAASRDRGSYVGPWLPEPIVVATTPSPEQEVELSSSLSVAFLTLLERLSPEERAGFVLREVFDCPYPEIANTLGKSEAACRQMIHRARERVRSDEPRFEIDPREHRRLLDQFSAALQTGDEQALVALFAEDAVLVSDGGGKAPAATRALQSNVSIARLFAGVGRKAQGRLSFTAALVNGDPGLIVSVDGRRASVLTIQAAGGRIRALYHVMNPDKLHALGISGQDSPWGSRPGA